MSGSLDYGCSCIFSCEERKLQFYDYDSLEIANIITFDSLQAHIQFSLSWNMGKISLMVTIVVSCFFRNEEKTSMIRRALPSEYFSVITESLHLYL